MTAIEDLIKRVEELEREVAQLRAENPRKPLCVACFNAPAAWGPNTYCYECNQNQFWREARRQQGINSLDAK